MYCMAYTTKMNVLYGLYHQKIEILLFIMYFWRFSEISLAFSEKKLLSPPVPPPHLKTSPPTKKKLSPPHLASMSPPPIDP